MRVKLSWMLVGVGLVVGAAGVFGQGMPPEARKNIHTLFDNHESITRKVTMTKDGYVAVTESADARVAAALKGHVKQMNQRLKSGRMVRRWDPAFEEYVRHYKDIDHDIQPTKKGLKIVVRGKNAAAIKVAQNHANVLMGFVKHGWKEHDKRHAAVSGALSQGQVAGKKGCGKDCGEDCKESKPCCQKKCDKEGK